MDNMIYEQVIIDGQDIVLCADENAEIKVWVNNEIELFLPIVFDGQLTIRLTSSGIDALREEKFLRYADIEKVEFWENY